MTLTDKIKQIGRKYVVPAALAGAVTLGSYGCEDKVELPISQETRETIIVEQSREYEAKQKQAQTKLDGMIHAYWSNLDSAEEQFNKYLSQRDTLTIREQETVLEKYNSALDLRKEITEYAKQEELKSGSNLLFPKEHSQLYHLLNCNINGVDFGTTELEKELKKSGLNIPVEEKNNGVEGFFVLGGLFSAIVGLAGLIGGAIVYYDKRRKLKCHSKQDISRQ